MKTIFIVVATKPRINFMLRGDVFRLLKEKGHQIVIISPFGNDASFRTEFGGANVAFEPLVPLRTAWKKLINVRNIALAISHPELDEARRIHHHITRRYRTRGEEALAAGERFVRLLPKLVRQSEAFWNTWESIFIRSRSYTDIFARYAPHAIITASAGAEGEDIPFIVYGNRKRIPVFAVDGNIDVFTFRYFSRVRPGVTFMLFNETQQREAHELQGVPYERLIVTGAARYDYALRQFKPVPREEFLKRIGVNPAKKLVTYGAKIPKMYPHNRDIMEMLMKGIASSRIPAELYVRFDPGHDPDLYAPFLKEHGIKFERAEIASDQEHVLNLLYHSDVVVSVGSTFNVEASLVGAPSIFVTFDGYEHYQDPNDSYSIIYNLELFKRLKASGGIVYAENEEGLERAVARYLKDRNLDDESRKKLVQSTTYKGDGYAGARIVDFILSRIS